MSEILIVERHGNAALVRFNRPDKQNALSAEVLDAIDTTLAELDKDASIRGVVITGNEKVFSTGGDLKEALSTNSLPQVRAWLDRFARANGRIESISKPVIAAIEGFCLTGGLEIALCCDIRMAATNAKFGITSSRIGTVAGAGGPQRLARLIGPERTKDMLFGAEFIDAQKALAIGLVSEVLEPGQVIPAALARIELYAQRAPLAVWYAKEAINNGLQMDLQSALHFERQLTTQLFMTDDRKEGMAAFLEKRPAKFTGK
jgi:enoyl-CoA hydratase/carnithine racemase